MLFFLRGLLQGELEHCTKRCLFVDDPLLKGIDQHLEPSLRILGERILVEFPIYVGSRAFERSLEEQVLLRGEIAVGRRPRDERCVRDLRYRRSLPPFQELHGGRKYRRAGAAFLIDPSFLLPSLGHGVSLFLLTTLNTYYTMISLRDFDLING